MPWRRAAPRNRILFSAVVLVMGLALVWYQRAHPAGARSSQKPFLSQSPSSERTKTFVWVPAYPGATISDIRTKMSRGELSYGFSFRTPDGSEKILSFFQSRLEATGFKVEIKQGDGGGRLHAEDSGGKRGFDLTVGKTAEGSEVGAIASEK